LNVPFEATARPAKIFPNDTGAALTGLSVKPATAILAIATDEARSNELVLLRNLLKSVFLGMGILSESCAPKYG
jgi:hypothetical protein